MTEKQLQNYYEMRIRQLSISGALQPDEIRDFVNTAISMGVDHLWTARNWSFREKRGTLTISTDQEYHTLPDDFEKMVSIREKDSTTGRRLNFVLPEEFHDAIPRPTEHTNTYPQVYTITRSGKKWYISFYPHTSSGTYYMDYLTSTPDSPAAIPSEATEALVACIDMYIMAPENGVEFDRAKARADLAIQELERRDSAYGGSLHRFYDDTEVRTSNEWPWV